MAVDRSGGGSGFPLTGIAAVGVISTPTAARLVTTLHDGGAMPPASITGGQTSPALVTIFRFGTVRVQMWALVDTREQH
jgi:hypothetical protein